MTTPSIPVAALPSGDQSTALALQPEAIIISRRQVLEGDVAEAEKTNAEAEFDYADPQENQRARSHIYKLRGIKGRIEAARVEEKADILQRGKEIDSQAKGLTKRVQALIDPHQAELDRITQAEAERQAAHKRVIDSIRAMARVPFDAPSHVIAERLAQVKAVDTTGLEEYIKDGKIAKADAILELDKRLVHAQGLEAAAAELARLAEEDRQRKAAEAEAERKRKADELTAKIRQEAQAEAEAVAVEQIEKAEQRAAAAEVRADAAEASSRASDPQALPRPPIEPPAAIDVAQALGRTTRMMGMDKPAASFDNPFAGPNQSRAELVWEICQAMQGLDRRGAAEALADNKLHKAIKVCY